MDVIGNRFGRLLAVEYAEPHVTRGGQNVKMVKCICDCGNIVVVRQQSLTNGDTKSCGCLRRDVGALRAKYNAVDRELRIRYKGMMQRCYNKNSQNYKYYGENGISVCKEWRDNFESFRDWSITNGYSKELTLDRIDVSGNYSPENCRWVSWDVQQNNRTSNHIIEFNGMTGTIADVAKANSINYSTLRSRLYRSQNNI